jgi:hypothetical protein
MTNDLTISAIGLPVATHARVPSYQPAPAATGAPTPAGPPPPSPTLRFDPAAGVLVIEFHNDAGEITNSIPTQQQLLAYRSHAGSEAPPATPPVLAETAGTTGQKPAILA